MPETIQICLEALAGGFRPDPLLTISEWADEHRILPRSTASEPGPYRTSRTPYLKEIMDALSPRHPADVVVLMKGSQIGATEAGNNWLGYCIHMNPGPILMVQPTDKLAMRISKQRIAPMINSSPVLANRVRPAKSRDSSNTILEKEFPGGSLILTGSNSAVGLRSSTIKYLFMDERSAFEKDVRGEGDPAALAMKRTANYGRHKKVFIPSTPTLKNICPIEFDFLESDQRFFNVPCPECGIRQVIRWKQIQWEKGDDGEHLPATVYLECEACGFHIKEHHKTRMLAGGEWIATAVAKDPRKVGFHLSALYSPLGWYSWRDAVEDFLKAKRKGREEMKTWVNNCLGEPYQEPGTEIEWAHLFHRREYFAAEAPQGVLCITSGVDTQDDRLEAMVMGWGLGEECWLLDYRVLWGDPDQQQVWDDLDNLRAHEYIHASGKPLKINSMCIDSGGHRTQAVYQYCAEREFHRVWAIRGQGGWGLPTAGKPTRRQIGESNRKVKLFPIGVDNTKLLFYGRLQRKEPGPGFIHLPTREWCDERFLQGLTSEALHTRFVKGFPKREWVLKIPGARNEPLDCGIYGLGAFYLLYPDLDVLAKQAEDWGPPESEPTSKPKPTPSPKKRRKTSSFVNRGRRK